MSFSKTGFRISSICGYLREHLGAHQRGRRVDRLDAEVVLHHHEARGLDAAVGAVDHGGVRPRGLPRGRRESWLAVSPPDSVISWSEESWKS